MKTTCHKAESINSNSSLESQNKRLLYLTFCLTTHGPSLRRFYPIVALILLYCMKFPRIRVCDMLRMATELVQTPGELYIHKWNE